MNVLIEMGGGFDLCVNKLFVLPGTKISQIMMNDNMDISKVEKSEALFNYYCRLFWITSFTSHARQIINLIEKLKICIQKY